MWVVISPLLPNRDSFSTLSLRINWRLSRRTSTNKAQIWTTRGRSPNKAWTTRINNSSSKRSNTNSNTVLSRIWFTATAPRVTHSHLQLLILRLVTEGTNSTNTEVAQWRALLIHHKAKELLDIQTILIKMDRKLLSSFNRKGLLPCLAIRQLITVSPTHSLVWESISTVEWGQIPRERPLQTWLRGKITTLNLSLNWSFRRLESKLCRRARGNPLTRR